MITAYPVAGKAKSRDICAAFAKGCDGDVSTDNAQLAPGPAFFYGVDKSNIHIFNEVRATAREYYYCDNSYFDSTRQQFFRVTKNRLQHSGIGQSDGKRFKDLGIPLKPKSKRIGTHIVVCPQSDSFMKDIAQYSTNWTQDTLSILRNFVFPIRLRLWSGDKSRLAATLADDLDGAHALVTWSSAAAVTALLSGVPVFCSTSCVAGPMALADLDEIDRPYFPNSDVLLNWAGVMADNQWTLAEMADGTAWRMLNG